MQPRMNSGQSGTVGSGSALPGSYELGVVPAQLVADAVAMFTDAVAQPPDFGDELLARHLLEILVHVVTSPRCVGAHDRSNPLLRRHTMLGKR
jgi:hypothetical protein